MGIFKEQKTGVVSFAFRTPITDGYDFCYKCNKFMGTNEDFDKAQLDKGPGKQMCCGCEEFSEMFF